LELYSLADAMKGRPGLNGYAYQADVYCVKCGHQIILSLVDTFPKYRSYSNKIAGRVMAISLVSMAKRKARKENR